MVQEKNEEERELEKKLEKYFLPFLHERLWLKFVRGWELFMDCPAQYLWLAQISSLSLTALSKWVGRRISFA